jgi:UDP-GlcNAc:undecaprenyl-phosphate GlcNAc-1-phosphate transferase
VTRHVAIRDRKSLNTQFSCISFSVNDQRSGKQGEGFAVILFVWSFIVSLAISMLMTFWVQKTAVARGLLVPPASDRHLHTRPLPRIGGVGIYLSFLITVVAFCAIPKWGQQIFAPRTLIGFLIATGAIFSMGVCDDLKSIKPRSKLIFELFASIFIYFAGFGLHDVTLSIGGYEIGKPLGFVVTVIWILLITNAFNLIDGLDGLAVGSALLSAIVVIATSLVRHNDLVTMLSCALFGTLLGFVPFNFHPASIFMGDSGSLFIGFALGTLSLNGWSGHATVMGVAVPVLCFGLPIVDVTLAVARRFLRQQPLFRADADHVHHKLLKRGLSQQHAVLLLYGATAAFVLASILLIREEKMLVPVLGAAFLGIGLGVQQLRYPEFSGGWLGLRPYLRRRHTALAEQCIRHASQSLESCADFRSICQVLKENLQPIGIDGIRFTLPGSANVPSRWLRPLRPDAQGRLVFSWSRRRNKRILWQYSLQLPSLAQNRAAVSVFRVKPIIHSRLAVKVFSDNFRFSLSTAIARATKRIEIVLPVEADREPRLAANSLPDSA